ncbi:MAG: hypothetical protein RMK29_07385 [Myxococcales bacterium]|nr:hypothetical protein [Myxococcota bacterium]MDW8281516.1 hypothetical protein [Myxococcales bacterium]
MRASRRLGQTALVVVGALVGAAVASQPVLALRPYTPRIEAGQPTVKLSIRTSPRVKARVFWGRLFLGETPLDLRWPRDSGPLDVVVEARGYLPVHTRLYTFDDDRLSVKLTPEADKKSLFGYRHEWPADGGPIPDGGSAGDAGGR